MPDIETCTAKATVSIGRFTEADVECGREADHDPPHITSQTTVATIEKKSRPATIIYTW